MKHPLETRERDAIDFNTDGRCFRLDIEGDVLRLNASAYLTDAAKLRNFSAPLIVAFIILYLLTSVLKVVPTSDFWIHLSVIFGVSFLWLLVVAKYPTRYAARWDFDRAHNTLQINAADFAPLSEIARLVGIKRGKNHFLLAIDFKDGKRKFIGRYFSKKEFSWREDVQKIASFLNVPLLIPDVYEV